MSKYCSYKIFNAVFQNVYLLTRLNYISVFGDELMAQQVLNLTCPGCGAPIEVGMKICPYGHPVTISTFNSVYSMPSPTVKNFAKSYEKKLREDPTDKQSLEGIAFCYLKLKLYDKALEAFEKAFEENFDNAELYFYSAVCLLKGKKAFLQQRPTIEKILEYVNAAIVIEPRGIFYYFMAYIKYDYFKRKFLNVSPDFQDTLSMAKEYGYSEFDIVQLFSVLGVDKPTGF